jgi:hypothetical protein
VLVSLIGGSTSSHFFSPLKDPSFFTHLVKVGTEKLTENSVNNTIVWNAELFISSEDESTPAWVQVVGSLIDQDVDSCNVNFRVVFDSYAEKQTGNQYPELNVTGIYCPGGKPMITSDYLIFNEFALMRIANSTLESYSIDLVTREFILKSSSHSINHESLLLMYDTYTPVDSGVGKIFINIAGEAFARFSSIKLTIGTKMFWTFDENTKILDQIVTKGNYGDRRLVFITEDIYSRPRGEVAIYIIRAEDIVFPDQNFGTPFSLEFPYDYYTDTNFNPRYVRYAYSGKRVPFNWDIDRSFDGSDILTMVKDYGVEGYSNLRFGVIPNVNSLSINYFDEDLYSHVLPFQESKWQPHVPYTIKFMTTSSTALFIPPIAMSTYYTCKYSTLLTDCEDVYPVIAGDEATYLRTKTYAGHSIFMNAFSEGFFHTVIHTKERVKGQVFSFYMRDCPKATPFLKIIDKAGYQTECIADPEGAITGYKLISDVKRYERCSDLKCAECANDVQVCQTCVSGFKFNQKGECTSCPDPNCSYCSGFNTCGACKPGYIFNEDFVCVESDALNCYMVYTALTDVCKQCTVGYHFNPVAKEPVCNVCDTGYSLDSNGICSPVCAFENCNCKVPGTCDGCKTGFYGSKCLTLAGSCSDTITGCSLCTNLTSCATCVSSLYLTGEKCDRCQIGYDFDDEGKCVSLTQAQESLQTVVTDFNREIDNAVIQFSANITTLNTTSFNFTLIDDTDGQSYPCPKCRAEISTTNPNSLQIIFDPSIPILKGRCIITYYAKELIQSTSRRSLQGSTVSSGAIGNFTVENVHLTGTGRDADISSYNAYTAVNAFRFFATVGLSVLNTGHAFWSTHWFSWLQLWANLRGPFLVYPDRFLQWHSKWYILVINFGEPFRNWNDWNSNGISCAASTEYPLNKLGCSWTDTFGQNFIVILFVAAFCIIVSVIYLLTAKGIEENATGAKGWLRRITYGLGYNYFLRWIQALQPSIIFFSILQWYTHRNTPHQSLGVVLAALFFTYYFVVAIISTLLSFRIAKELKDNTERKLDENLEVVGKKIGGMFAGYAFQFIDLKTASGAWQLQGPLIEFLRVTLVSIFMVTVGERNKVSLGLVFMIEVLRYMYVLATFNTKISIFYALFDAATGFLFIGYLILKMSSAADVTEYNRQKNLGAIMALIVTIVWAICLFNMVFDLIRGILYMVGANKFTDYSQALNEMEDGYKQEHGPESPQSDLIRPMNTNPSSPEARARDRAPEPSRAEIIGNNSKPDMDNNPQSMSHRSQEVNNESRHDMDEGPASENRARLNIVR